MKFIKTLTLLIITCATGYAQCGTRSSYEMDSTWESFSYDLGRLDSIYLSKKSTAIRKFLRTAKNPSLSLINRLLNQFFSENKSLPTSKSTVVCS
jgi:hypothetical protein